MDGKLGNTVGQLSQVVTTEGLQPLSTSLGPKLLRPSNSLKPKYGLSGNSSNLATFCLLLILLLLMWVLILTFGVWSKPERNLDRKADDLDEIDRDLLELRLAKFERILTRLDMRVQNAVAGGMQEVTAAVEKVQGSVDKIGDQVSKIPAAVGSSMAKLKIN